MERVRTGNDSDRFFFDSKMRLSLATFLLLAGCIAVCAQELQVHRQQSNEPDSPLTILYKPKAKYPIPETGTICMQGTVTLRVTFRFDGTIGTISTIKGLPQGLTRVRLRRLEKCSFYRR